MSLVDKDFYGHQPQLRAIGLARQTQSEAVTKIK